MTVLVFSGWRVQGYCLVVLLMREWGMTNVLKGAMRGFCLVIVEGSGVFRFWGSGHC